jgi:hypothetical protein
MKILFAATIVATTNLHPQSEPRSTYYQQNIESQANSNPKRQSPYLPTFNTFIQEKSFNSTEIKPSKQAQVPLENRK